MAYFTVSRSNSYFIRNKKNTCPRYAARMVMLFGSSPSAIIHLKRETTIVASPSFAALLCRVSGYEWDQKYMGADIIHAGDPFLSPVISFVFDWRYGYIGKSNGTNSFLMRLCTESDWNGILLCSTSLSNMDIPKSCLRIQITKKMIRLKARYSITNLTISIRLHYWTERREWLLQLIKKWEFERE